MRSVVVLAAVGLVAAGCGAHPNPVVRIAIVPAPEGPSLVVTGRALPPLPKPLPPSSTQRCRGFGATVTLTFADGSRRRYGPCSRPAAIERIRIALVRAAATGALPQTPGDWRSVLSDWADNGRLDRWHSCAAVREAFRHIPPDPASYTTIWDDLQADSRAVCVP